MSLSAQVRPWKVVVTDYIQDELELEKKAFPGAQFILLEKQLTQAHRQEALRQADALLVWHCQVDKKLIDQLECCKIVVRYGVGFENIDLGSLQNKNIAFSNTPDYGTEEVANSACAMILAFSRATYWYHQTAKSIPPTWQENVAVGLSRLSTQTLGVVGVGRIGEAVIRRMEGFGMECVGFDPYLSPTQKKALGIDFVPTLSKLLSVSDYVSLHCPQTHETRAMVNSLFLSQMKETAYLINTARGGLIESLEVVERALEQNQIQGFGLDVLPQEPPPAQHSLIQAWQSEKWLGRLLIQPHTAFYSTQSYQEMRQKAAQTAQLYLTSQTHRYKIDERFSPEPSCQI